MKKFSSFIFLLLIWLSSCDDFTNVIEIDQSDFVSKGVLFAELKNYQAIDTLFERGNLLVLFNPEVGQEDNQVYITESRPVNDDFNSFYEANVEFLSPSDTISIPYFQLHKDSIQRHNINIHEFFHHFDYDFQSGQEYTIKAKPLIGSEFKQWEPIEGTDVMPKAVKFTVDTLSLFKKDTLDNQSYSFAYDRGSFKLTIQDEKDRENLYALDVAVVIQEPNGSIYRDILNFVNKNIDDDNEIFSGSILNYNQFEDFDISKNGHIEFKFEFKSYRTMRFKKDSKYQFYFRLSNYSDHLANFTKSYYEYEYNIDNPFVEPIEIYSNIKNGYGIFGLKNTSYSEFELIQ